MLVTGLFGLTIVHFLISLKLLEDHCSKPETYQDDWKKTGHFPTSIILHRIFEKCLKNIELMGKWQMNLQSPGSLQKAGFLHCPLTYTVEGMHNYIISVQLRFVFW